MARPVSLALGAALLLLCASQVRGYVAAVSHHVAVERSTAQDTLDANLAMYKLHVETAAAAGADILVLPEFGLGGDFTSRDTLFPYTEDVPGVGDSDVIPCDRADSHLFPISANMSCFARANNITVAFELYDLKYCDRTTDEHCPADGRYQYNTELVLSDDGSVIARYYKTHEWYPLKAAIDEPVDQPLIKYTTSFGVQFGIFMCFDIMWPSPAKDLVEDGVRHFTYSVAMDANIGEEVHRVWSKNNGAVLLAGNLSLKHSAVYVNGEKLPSEIVPVNGTENDSVVISTVSA